MAKYKVEVGGFVGTFNKKENAFVSRFRHRNLIVYFELLTLSPETHKTGTLGESSIRE